MLCVAATAAQVDVRVDVAPTEGERNVMALNQHDVRRAAVDAKPSIATSEAIEATLAGATFDRPPATARIRNER